MQASGRYATERLCKQNALSSPKTTKKFLQAESGKGRLLHWNEEKKRLKALPEVWREGSNFHCRGGGAAGKMETHSLEKEAWESMSGSCAPCQGSNIKPSPSLASLPGSRLDSVQLEG